MFHNNIKLFLSSLSPLALLSIKNSYRMTSSQLDEVMKKQIQVLVLERRVQVKKFSLAKYTEVFKVSMLI